MIFQSLLKRAQQYCVEKKQRFTAQRCQVLDVLITQSRAMGAYEILEALSTADHSVKPPTVYRAIEFWVKHGFIHKIESLNAYVICSHSHSHLHSLLMICDHCRDVSEVVLPQLPSAIQKHTLKHQFMMNKSTLEISGRCAQCRV